MLSGGQAEWQQVLAAGAVELGLRNIKAAGWARSHWFRLIFSLDWTPGDTLDLRLELGRDLLDVLGSDQDASPVVRLALESRLRTLTNARGHDIAHVLWEERDIVADADEEASSTQMIAKFDEALGQLVGME